MSIELEKVVQIYQQCEALIQSKVELMSVVSIVQWQKPQPNLDYDYTPTIIQVGIHKIVQSWFRKLSSYKDYEQRHGRSVRTLKQKSQGLKNNTELLSRQSQLITETEQLIEHWSKAEDPISYYQIKNRQNFQKVILEKMKQIRDSEEKTEESMAPLYAHKLQKQIKDVVIQLFYEETEIDRQTMDYVAITNNQMCKKLQKFGREVTDIQPTSIIAEMANKFFADNSQALQRKFKVSQNCFNRYFQSLSIVVKKTINFWQSLLKNTNGLLEQIENIRLHFEILGKNLSETQNKIYKLLEDIPDSLGSIFRVEVIYNLIKILQKTFEIAKVLQKMKGRIQKVKQNIDRNERSARQYSQDLLKFHGARVKNFYQFTVQDKNFLEDMGKGQKSLNINLLHGFRDFLLDGFNLLKQVRSILSSNLQFHQIQPHRVGQIVGRLIITNNYKNSKISTSSQSEKDGIGSSRMSTRLNTIQTNRKKQKSEKNQKIRKIQQFLQKIFIFDFSSVKFQEYFSCALGPKLLLHGKIYVLPSGIYYESFFNKKNLFFGKTKLFVPRQDIMEIDEKNTLMIFPDAVEVKTAKGFLYFHALGARRRIATSLIEMYFPQNVQQIDNLTEINFKQTANTTIPSQMDINCAEQPLQTVMQSTIFKGIKLNTFFRRYFSDDKFEIRGQVYPNFKCYYLEQVEAIEPTSSPMIPEPPSYFCYENQESYQNSNQTSERMHTYKRKIPKIPFVSSGGYGHCEQKQVYHWISSTLFYIMITSVVKGFSLTEGMQVLVKMVFKQVSQGVKVSISADIKFFTNSSTNSLLKAPAMSNLKDVNLKMFDIINKYEKGKKLMGGNKKTGGKNEQQIEYLKERVQILQKQNKSLTKKWKIMTITFAVLYAITILSFSFIF